MALDVVCVPVETGPSEPPCADVGGVAHVVALVPADAPEIDQAQAASFFAFAVSIVLIAHIVGVTVGAIIRVIRAV